MQTKTQAEELQNYLTDASNMAGGHALKLFLPETAEDVAAILRDADEQKMPVTVSGARTGTVGGAIPFGGFVISMERMNKIIGVDKNAGTATVQPGVILGDLQKAVDADGLFYPPDPTEWSCQIGGTVATNASGSRSFKYGATRNFVERLKVVLADGDMIDLRRGEIKADESGMLVLTTLEGREIQVKVPTYKRPQVRKNVSGYFAEPAMDAIDLFIGSEGTLGVIVEIELSLLSKPRGFFSGIVFFETHGALLEFVDEARDLSFAARRNPAPAASGSDLRPAPDASLIEYFDDRALKFISEKFPEVPPEMAGAIYFEQETNEGSEDALLEAWNALLEKHNADLESSWFTTTDADNEKMREFRHALPVSVNERIVRSGQRKVGTDMSVPDDNFLDFLRLYKRVLNESGLDHVIFGHIGDCHLHANILPKNDDEATRARHLYGRFVADAIMLGGTVSAEHGIGKLKRKYLNVMMGERYLSEMAAVKKAFDPKGILGRGNMFDEKFLG
jgi:D-lactate dehydrogenase (cytochrome)